MNRGLPLCPKCGDIARIAHVRTTHVQCHIYEDGSLGRPIACTGTGGPPTGYECGRGHYWGFAPGISHSSATTSELFRFDRG